ncbi:hypothetical protein G7Y89_g11370 [Cudoniella acicularis]|uniref:YCII-related domain-containing protein n=1 Tax=Cudoniella acicularis TaxID=354080 RepID=A0A8H4VY32_9HELO|nr:hypothetical protein G7Y89_g11370 [Cudoniella acicularis]
MASAASAGKFEWLVVVPDHEGVLTKRMEVRPKHFEGLKPNVDNGFWKMGGALLSEVPQENEGLKIQGSAMIALASSKEEVLEILKKDIYNSDLPVQVRFQTSLRDWEWGGKGKQEDLAVDKHKEAINIIENSLSILSEPQLLSSHNTNTIPLLHYIHLKSKIPINSPNHKTRISRPISTLMQRSRTSARRVPKVNFVSLPSTKIQSCYWNTGVDV